MAMSPFLGPAGGSRGCCEGGRYIVAPPGLDQHPSLGETVEDFAVQQLVAKGAVGPKASEAQPLFVAFLPGRTRRDVERLHADFPEPFLDLASDEFAAVVDPDC